MKLDALTARLLRLALPIVGANLGQILMGVIDTAMVAKLGAIPLAASAVAIGVFVFPLVFGIGVSYAIAPLISAEVGRGRGSRAGTVLTSGLAACMVVGVVLMGIIFGLVELVPQMGQDARLVEPSQQFLRVLAFNMLPLMAYLALKQYSDGLQRMTPGVVVALGAVGINYVVNLALIEGRWGFPALGLVGAAYGSLIARVCQVIAMLVWLFSDPFYKKFGISFLRRLRGQWSTAKTVLSVGVPAGVQYSLEAGAFGVAALLIGAKLGPIPLAAHQVAISIASVTFMAALGLSEAGSILVGEFFGMNNLSLQRQVAKRAWILVVGFMGTMGILFIVIPEVFIRVYTQDEVVIATAVQLLAVAALFQLSDGVQAVGAGLLRGRADTQRPMYITLFAYWVAGIPIAYFFGVYLLNDVRGVWYGLSIGLTFSAALLTWRFLGSTRRQQHAERALRTEAKAA